MDYTEEDLKEAQRQISSTLQKLRRAAETLETKENPDLYKSQITLAKRRIRAFEISLDLLQREIEQKKEKA